MEGQRAVICVLAGTSPSHRHPRSHPCGRWSRLWDACRREGPGRVGICGPEGRVLRLRRTFEVILDIISNPSANLVSSTFKRHPLPRLCQGPSHPHLCVGYRLDTFCCKSSHLSRLSTRMCRAALGVSEQRSGCHLPAPSLPKKKPQTNNNNNKTKQSLLPSNRSQNLGTPFLQGFSTKASR